MKGTSRSGWAAAAIAAERHGVTSAHAFVIEYARDRPGWRVLLGPEPIDRYSIGGRPGAFELHEEFVHQQLVDQALAIHPEQRGQRAPGGRGGIVVDQPHWADDPAWGASPAPSGSLADDLEELRRALGDL